MRNNLIHDFVKAYLSKHVKPGDVVLDATLGNGYDSEYLLQLGAKVHAFDIQLDAISHTRHRLGQPESLYIHHTSFVHMFDYVTNFKGVIFNLGYLPNGDKNITTKSSETIKTIQLILDKMTNDTFILITAYPGHPEGLKEALSIEDLIKTLPTDYLAYTYQIKNRVNAPYNIIIEKP